MATVEGFIQAVRDALPFLHKLERGQRRAHQLFGGTDNGIEPNVNLQSAVTVSHNKTTDIIAKCNTVVAIFDQLMDAIAAVQATEFPDPNPIPISEQDWEAAQIVLGEVNAAYGEISQIPAAVNLGLQVLSPEPKTQH